MRSCPAPPIWSRTPSRPWGIGLLPRRPSAAVAALHPVLEKRLREMDMTELYETVELPLCAVLARMERRGFLVDGKALAAFGRDMAGKITELEQRIYDQAGETFNINSPKQLGTVLFQKIPKPAGPPTPMCWKSSAGRPPWWRMSCSTASTPS